MAVINISIMESVNSQDNMIDIIPNPMSFLPIPTLYIKGEPTKIE